MANAIISPAVEVNGTFIAVQPESVVYRKGSGTTTCVAQSVGQSVEVVHKPNLSEAYGYVSFKTENTVANLSVINTFRDAGSDNTVLFTDSATGFSGKMTNARIINEIERTLSSDGDGTVEFCGNQISGNV